MNGLFRKVLITLLFNTKEVVKVIRGRSLKKRINTLKDKEEYSLWVY